MDDTQMKYKLIREIKIIGYKEKELINKVNYLDNNKIKKKIIIQIVIKLRRKIVIFLSIINLIKMG